MTLRSPITGSGGGPPGTGQAPALSSTSPSRPARGSRAGGPSFAETREALRREEREARLARRDGLARSAAGEPAERGNRAPGEGRGAAEPARARPSEPEAGPPASELLGPAAPQRFDRPLPRQDPPAAAPDAVPAPDGSAGPSPGPGAAGSPSAALSGAPLAAGLPAPAPLPLPAAAPGAPSASPAPLEAAPAPTTGPEGPAGVPPAGAPAGATPRAAAPGPASPAPAADPDPGLAEAALVLRQVKAELSPGLRRVRVDLEPPELGRLVIRVAQHEGGLRAVVEADSAATLELLQRQAPELRAALAAHGVAAEDLSFQLGSDRSHQRGDARGGSRRPGVPGSAGRAAEADAPPASAPARLLPNHSGVDTYA